MSLTGNAEQGECPRSTSQQLTIGGDFNAEGGEGGIRSRAEPPFRLIFDWRCYPRYLSPRLSARATRLIHGIF